MRGKQKARTTGFSCNGGVGTPPFNYEFAQNSPLSYLSSVQKKSTLEIILETRRIVQICTIEVRLLFLQNKARIANPRQRKASGGAKEL
jgi:hypothetical protein